MMTKRPLTTEAAILVAQNEDLIVDTIDLPQELGIGQVSWKFDVVVFADPK